MGILFRRVTIRKVRIPGMGRYFRKAPGRTKRKESPDRQDTGTGHGSMAINTSSASGRRQRPGSRRRRQKGPAGTGRKRLPSWNLPLTSCRRRQKIKSWLRQGGKRSGTRKNWSRRKNVCRPAAGCGWRPFLTRRPGKRKNA